MRTLSCRFFPLYSSWHLSYFCCVVRKLFSWSSRLLWASFHILTFLTWKILIFQIRKVPFFKVLYFCHLKQFSYLESSSTSLLLPPVSGVLPFLSSGCCLLCHFLSHDHDSVLFWGSGQIAQLWQKLRNSKLSAPFCSPRKVFTSSCLLRSKGFCPPTSGKGEKKHFPSLQLLYFLQGQAGNRSSKTK